MVWSDIISFSDHNRPWRFNVTTERADNTDQCKVLVEELDSLDKPVDQFNFVYDITQEMPLADFELHEKPIMQLVVQMLAIENDPKKW